MGAPFIKWAGGKGRLLAQLTPLLPQGFERMRYTEPFLGGGAMFFALAPRVGKTLLADKNEDLIGAYRAVRDDVEGVIDWLTEPSPLTMSAYYDVREAFNAHDEESPCQRAAWFIYLNRTCFNGLWRVNRKGEFNVPIGDYTSPTICDATALRAASKALQGTLLLPGPFQQALVSVAGVGDFVYLDPPYVPASKTASFTGYAKGGFTENDQRELAATFFDLHSRGAKLMLSNSDTPLVRELYGAMNLTRVSARRAINSKGGKRGPVGELVVRNYQNAGEAAA